MLAMLMWVVCYLQLKGILSNRLSGEDLEFKLEFSFFSIEEDPYVLMSDI